MPFEDDLDVVLHALLGMVEPWAGTANAMSTVLGSEVMRNKSGEYLSLFLLKDHFLMVLLCSVLWQIQSFSCVHLSMRVWKEKLCWKP